MAAQPAPVYRRPTEDDHDAIVRRIDDWAGGRTARHLMPRLWFRHFTGTSWVADRGDGRPIGLAIGFVSPDQPTQAVLHLVAVDPRHRRDGVGRELVTRTVADAIQRGAGRITTVAWPDDRPTIAFLEAVGFTLLEPPDGQRLYGRPARADFDEPGDDRAELELLVPGRAR
ncbi:MAG TPA: GNAT family N-acetyltransferase [Candidatus Limnocylindrales bacterium]|nr:GNAT family N-acetyltransferase [Candidatus Limnocylindrales bacterium]